MRPAIHLITLGTQNLKRATHFYEEGLGFPRMKLEEDADISFFELQGTWLALYPWELLAEDAFVASQNATQMSAFRGVTLAHNVRSEEEVRAVLEEAQQAGAALIKPAQKTAWGGFSGYFSDMDRHLWEVAFNPFFWPGPKDEETHTGEKK